MAQQGKDGFFKPVDSGQTLFSGDKVRDREAIVAQVFRVCLFIESVLSFYHTIYNVSGCVMCFCG